MAPKSIKLNYTYNLIYQILVLITPLITTPYLSRILEADGIGKCSFVESVCSYFVLFATLGLTTFGQREVSYVQNRKHERSVVFWETNILKLFTSSISIITYLGFALANEDCLLYLVLIFNLFSVVINITWFFQGLEEFGKIVLRNSIVNILGVAYVFLFVKTKNDILIYLFGISFFQFFGNLTLWFRLPQYIEKPNIKELHPFRHIRTVISLFVPTIAIQVYTVLDKTMIGIITSNSFENGYYEQSVKIVRIVLTLVTSLGTVMIPRIGYYFQNGKENDVRAYMYRAYRFVWFLGIPLCLGLISVSPVFVPWFFGEGYEKVTSIIGILAFLILAIGINNVTGMQYLIPTKRQNLFTLTVIIGSLTNLILNYFLIIHYQSIGAAIASVAAESVIAIIQIILVRKELEPKIIASSSIRYIFSGIVMYCYILYIRKYCIPNILSTLFLVISGAIVYFSLLLILKDNFFIDNIKNIINKIRIRFLGK